MKTENINLYNTKKLGSWELRHWYPLQIRPRLVIGWTPSISETPNAIVPNISRGSCTEISAWQASWLPFFEERIVTPSLHYFRLFPVPILRGKAASFMGLSGSQFRGHFLYTSRELRCTTLHAGPFVHVEKSHCVSFLILLIFSFTSWFLSSLLSPLNLLSKQRAQECRKLMLICLT